MLVKPRFTCVSFCHAWHDWFSPQFTFLNRRLVRKERNYLDTNSPQQALAAVAAWDQGEAGEAWRAKPPRMPAKLDGMQELYHLARRMIDGKLIALEDFDLELRCGDKSLGGLAQNKASFCWACFNGHGLGSDSHATWILIYAALPVHSALFVAI